MINQQVQMTGENILNQTLSCSQSTYPMTFLQTPRHQLKVIVAQVQVTIIQIIVDVIPNANIFFSFYNNEFERGQDYPPPPPSFIITLQIGTKGSNSQIALKYNSRLVIDVDTIMVWHTNLAIFDLILIQHKWKLSKTNENLYNAKKKKIKIKIK